MEEVKEIIKNNMLIHGHSTEIDVLPICQNLIDYISSICDVHLCDLDSIKLGRVNARRSLYNAKSFLEGNFNLHDVLMVNRTRLMRLNRKKVEGLDELIDIYNSLGVKVSPFRLPVKYVNKSSFYGGLALENAFLEDDEFYRRMNIYFKEIVLGKPVSVVTSACYTHEITHTQLESLKGSVECFYNSEVLPIFLELLCSSNNSLRILFQKRIGYLLYEFDNLYKYYYEKDNQILEFQMIIGCKYLVSIVKAFNLFLRYQDSSINEQRRILKLFQDVLDSMMTLEEALEKMEIDYESSLDINLVKRMHRVV